MEKYMLSIDQGTTSSRAILFDREMNIVRIAQQEFTQHFPRPGWVEHDPNELFDSQARVAVECLRRAGVDASDVCAAGITNQRESTVVWDRRTGAPVYNVIVWQDRRTAPLCDELRRQGYETLIRQKTGLLLDAYFSGTKLRWILDHVPGARQRAERGELLFGTVDTWLVWNFTKGAVHATDPSNASRTLLFNIHTLQWDDELLALLDIPRSMLPEVVPSSGEFGAIHPEFLGRAVPLAGMAGDQQAATFGNACLEPGMIKNTYGTGCFMLMHTGAEAKVSAHNLLTTLAWQREGHIRYALEGSIFMGGAIVQWLRDGLGVISDSSEVEALAASVPDNGGVYLVPAFVGLGAPHWDQYARGTIVGLTRGTTKAHIARAVLDAIAFQVTDLVQAMNADAPCPITTLRVDGGASVSDIMMQTQADLLRLPVDRPAQVETTAFGAAALAGLAAGVWGSLEEVAALRRSQHVFLPQRPQAACEAQYRLWRRAVDRALRWIENDV